MLNNFISGSVGGFIGTLVNTPFDVVKSRIQSVQVVPGVKPKYSWTYPAVLTVYREEGMAALYKGFVPKVLRLGPGGGVLLLVVEGTLAAFRKGVPIFSDWAGLGAHLFLKRSARRTSKQGIFSFLAIMLVGIQHRMGLYSETTLHQNKLIFDVTRSVESRKTLSCPYTFVRLLPWYTCTNNEQASWVA